MPLRSRRVRDVALCVVAALVVVVLATGVTLDWRVVEYDLAVVRAMHDAAVGGLTQIVLQITHLGGTGGAVVMTIAAAVVLLALRNWHGALALVLSVAATQAIVDLIKSFVGRSLPPADASQIDAAGYAFPSAHAATTTALYGLLALVAVAHLRGAARTAACTVTAVVIAGVGLTRLYLGAHYPTDVLAGWLVGMVVALLSWRLAQAVRGLADRRALSPA